MTDFVTHNGNQYETDKLIMIRGEGGKASVKLEQLKNLHSAQSSDKTDKAIVIPFEDGFHVLLKPVGEIKSDSVVYIISKVLLKKIKYDPNAKYVETEVQQERPVYRQERPPQNNWNNRPRTGGYRRDEAQVTGNFNREPRTNFSNQQVRPPERPTQTRSPQAR